MKTQQLLPTFIADLTSVNLGIKRKGTNKFDHVLLDIELVYSQLEKTWNHTEPQTAA